MNPEIEQLQKLVTTEKPKKADAIVWLQGNGYDRGVKTLELYQQKYAPIIMVTGNNERVVDNDHTYVADIVGWLKKNRVDAANILIDDTAMHTHDQAIHVIEVAKKRRWKNFLLVGSTHHQLRAFLAFLEQKKMQGWHGRIINQPVSIDWDRKPSGRSKTTREEFIDEIAKLQRYKNHLATIEEGIGYLQYA